MQPSDLELCTIKDLIDELMRRPTFLGVVIHSEQELKHRPWQGEHTFKVHFNANLQAEEVHRLLDTIADRLEHRHD